MATNVKEVMLVKKMSSISELKFQKEKKKKEK
jgi:hypothetical protein